MQGFIAIRRIHLITKFITLAYISCRAYCITKRTIVSARIFCRVSHNQRIHKTMTFKLITDTANTPIHHVTGCNNIRTGFSMRNRLLYQRIYRTVVQDITILINNAVLAMGREWIQSNISHNAHFRTSILNGFNCSLSQTIRIVCFFRKFCFSIHRRHWKKCHCRYA